MWISIRIRISIEDKYYCRMRKRDGEKKKWKNSMQMIHWRKNSIIIPLGRIRSDCIIQMWFAERCFNLDFNILCNICNWIILLRNSFYNSIDHHQYSIQLNRNYHQHNEPWVIVKLTEVLAWWLLNKIPIKI